MKLLDCVLIGLVCFTIVYILMRELGKNRGAENFADSEQKQNDKKLLAVLQSQLSMLKKNDPRYPYTLKQIELLKKKISQEKFVDATKAALAMQMGKSNFVDATKAALAMQMGKSNFKDDHALQAAMKLQMHEPFCGFHEGFECTCGPHTHQLQSEISRDFLNERNIGAPWYHPVPSEGFADTTGAQPSAAPAQGGAEATDKSTPLKPDDLLPKDMSHGWTQAYLNCKDLLANKNFVDTERFKFSNEVLDTRNTKYASLDIRKTPIVSHNPVSIWQKSPVEKSNWEYIRPSLDD